MRTGRRPFRLCSLRGRRAPDALQLSRHGLVADVTCSLTSGPVAGPRSASHRSAEEPALSPAFRSPQDAEALCSSDRRRRRSTDEAWGCMVARPSPLDGVHLRDGDGAPVCGKDDGRGVVERADWPGHHVPCAACAILVGYEDTPSRAQRVLLNGTDAPASGTSVPLSGM